MTLKIGFSVLLGEFLEIFVLKRYQKNMKIGFWLTWGPPFCRHKQFSTKNLQPGAFFRKMTGIAEFLIGPFWGANLGNALYDLKACFVPFVCSNVGKFLRFGLRLENVKAWDVYSLNPCRVHVDGLFGSRVKVQKRDCVYSIVAHVCRACSPPLTPVRTSPPF